MVTPHRLIRITGYHISNFKNLAMRELRIYEKLQKIAKNGENSSLKCFKNFSRKIRTCQLLRYSADSNNCAVWNIRVGNYIGLFGYNIKNYFLFNKFF